MSVKEWFLSGKFRSGSNPKTATNALSANLCRESHWSRYQRERSKVLFTVDRESMDLHPQYLPLWERSPSCEVDAEATPFLLANSLCRVSCFDPLFPDSSDTQDCQIG